MTGCDPCQVKQAADVIILGGGLAGLAAAYGLRRNYLLLEKTGVPGGLSNTVEERGFRFDQTGHLLHVQSPKIRKLVLNGLDEAPLQIERRARVFSHGTYTHYPFQANTFGLPKAVVAECLTEFIKVRTAAPARPSAPATFEEFIYRHFGSGIADHFMIPYNTKLWGVHPREITADWCRRFVPIPTTEEVVRGAIGLHRDDMGYNARFLYPKKGIGTVADGLARQVQNIRYHASPEKVDYKKKRVWVRGEWLAYRALITTIPLKSLVGLLEDPPKAIQHAASTLQCTSLRYLDVYLSRPSGTDYHWSYVPEKKYPFYRVGCYSNFSEEMSPPKKANLYVELASRRPVALDSLMPKVQRGLEDMGIIRRASDILFVRPRRIANAYVVYNHDYSKTVPKILAWLSKHGIFSAGRYATWEYASMEDALAQGLEAAKKAKEQSG